MFNASRWQDYEAPSGDSVVPFRSISIGGVPFNDLEEAMRDFRLRCERAQSRKKIECLITWEDGFDVRSIVYVCSTAHRDSPTMLTWFKWATWAGYALDPRIKGFSGEGWLRAAAESRRMNPETIRKASRGRLAIYPLK